MHRMSYPIKLGNGIENGKLFLEALKIRRCGVDGPWVKESLNSPEFLVSPVLMSVFPVILSVHELGFKDGGKRSDVHLAAIALGYSLCLSEVGPQYCLQSRRQEPGNHIHIGMKPIVITPGYARAFVVNFDERGRHTIDTDCYHHGQPLPPTCQIMFLRQE